MRTNVRLLQPALLTTILLIAALSACSDAPNEPTFPSTIPIMEATFRDAFTRYVRDTSFYKFATFAQTSWIPYQDSKNELGDINPYIFHRLKDLPIPIRRFSECEFQFGAHHPDFAGRGACIWIADITFNSRTSVVVYAGYFGDAMGAAGELYELRWEASSWKIVNVRRLFVS